MIEMIERSVKSICNMTFISSKMQVYFEMYYYTMRLRAMNVFKESIILDLFIHRKVGVYEKLLPFICLSLRPAADKMTKLLLYFIITRDQLPTTNYIAAFSSSHISICALVHI